MTTWSTNPSLERELKNTHVRNGQPTPPPFDDRSVSETSGPDPSYPPPPPPPPPSSYSYHHHKTTTIASTRRRRARPSVSCFSPSDTDEPQQDKAKREKFLERNRLAASKCRQKKKEHTMLLESRYKQQSDKKEQLMAEIARLRSEILGLKNEVLKHAQCGDEPIKLHLAQMVKRITYSDNNSNNNNNNNNSPAATTTLSSQPVDLADVVAVSSIAAATTSMTDNLTSSSSSSSEGIPAPALITATTTASNTTLNSAPASSLSFGFDDPLHLDPATSSALEQQLRRDSESSLTSDTSYAFSADDNFDDLINV
ncbi:hypothetical protein ASPZODRAFT_127025 [Penicilliopsis zonata CBS 506.65]|uniref:BZIP domain-containing protein n=1 Tax=Penicilliopsis zonata CBS 506.65 TaxID=1073090 RepID=A0A1L9SV96_9EURO|nr:hypothetical protein ASPZODRAFT_127025 [Penicilliopsis zonata CBS 506.65]OJJ51031.1 hypothetical protein ASPZODRAFT_127025 [Penicilliopsis zonata CBS 506.65]